jgi:hypothetical protein
MSTPGQKELAFQREINAAWLRLYPETLSVNMGSNNAAGIAHDNQGRLALFVKTVAPVAMPDWLGFWPITDLSIFTW